MKRSEIVGFIIGLVGIVLGIVLLMTGKIPDLGPWNIAIGIAAIIVIFVSSWKVTRGWFVPSLLGAAILLFAINHVLTMGVLPNVRHEGALLGLAWLTVIVDFVIAVLLCMALVLHVRALMKGNGSARSRR